MTVPALDPITLRQYPQPIGPVQTPPPRAAVVHPSAFTAFQEGIKLAKKASDLHSLRQMIQLSRGLTKAQVEELNATIDARFCAWNRAAVGEQKPRF